MATASTERSETASSPAALLMTLAFLNWFAFACWHTLFANFTIERVGFGWF